MFILFLAKATPGRKRKVSAAVTPKDSAKDSASEFADSRSKSNAGRIRKNSAVENMSSDDEIKFEPIRNDRYSGIYENEERAHNTPISPVKQGRSSTGKISRSSRGKTSTSYADYDYPEVVSKSKVREETRSGGKGSSTKSTKPVATSLEEDLDDWADSLAASQSQRNEPVSAFRSARLSGKRKLGYLP